MGKESGFLPRGHVTGQEAHGRVLGTRRHAAGRRARQRHGRSGGEQCRAPWGRGAPGGGLQGVAAPLADGLGVLQNVHQRYRVTDNPTPRDAPERNEPPALTEPVPECSRQHVCDGPRRQQPRHPPSGDGRWNVVRLHSGILVGSQRELSRDTGYSTRERSERSRRWAREATGGHTPPGSRREASGTARPVETEAAAGALGRLMLSGPGGLLFGVKCSNNSDRNARVVVA